MAKNKVKSGLVDIINGMKKDANAGSAWHVKRIAQLEAMLAAETGIEPTAAPEATAAPTIAKAASAPSAIIPSASLAPPTPPISATATAGPTASASVAAAASTAKHTAATAAILTSMSKEALEEIDRQKKLDTIKAKNKRDSDDKLLAAFEKGQDAIETALGGRKERKGLGSRIEDKKNSIKDFFTLRGFLDKTGIVKKGGGSLADDLLGNREDKKNFIKAQSNIAREDARKNKTGFNANDFAKNAGAKFDTRVTRDARWRKADAEVKQQMEQGGFKSEEELKNTRAYRLRAILTRQMNRDNSSSIVDTKKPGNVAANMGTPGGPVGSAMSSAMKSIASKPGSIGKSVMSSLSSGVGKTALQGVGKAAMGMMSGPAMAGIAAAAGPALAAAAPFVLGAAAVGVAGYGAYKAYKALTSKPDEESKSDTQIDNRSAQTSNKIKTALERKQESGTLTEGEQRLLDRSTKTVNEYRDQETAKRSARDGGENDKKVKKPEHDKLDAAMGRVPEAVKPTPISTGDKKPYSKMNPEEQRQEDIDRLKARIDHMRNPEAVKPTSASLIDSKSAENALAATEGKNTPNNVVVAPVTNNSVQNHPTTYKQLARNPDTTFTRHIDSRMSGAF